MAVAYILSALLGVPGEAASQPERPAADLFRASTHPFQGQRAWEHLKAICALGPRCPGAEGYRRFHAMIEAFCRRQGIPLGRQAFTLNPPSAAGVGRLENLILRLPPASGSRVLLGTHYDTRPWADQDPLPACRGRPILGANDGGSGVAVLLELAEILSRQAPAVGVDIVLFDGEDQGTDARGGWCLGSAAFRRAYEQALATDPQAPRYQAALVLDMVGDRDLTLFREQGLPPSGRLLARQVWAIARRLGHAQFRTETRDRILDDHVALIEAGIPSLLLIDLDYPPWHRTTDTLEQCSAESLRAVGQVVTTWVYLQR